MGFPGFPGGSVGVFPIIMINTAMSIAAFKDALMSVLHVVGFRRDSDDGSRDLSWSYSPDETGLSSSLILPSMSEELRQVLTVTLYDPGHDDALSSEDAQCAVCLADFGIGEEIRQLPFCSHIFHKVCLDRWLDHQQFTCPLCRASLVPEDIARKHRRREQELTEELILWFTSFHGAGLHGLWWQS